MNGSMPPPDRDTALILLAAGRSERFGGDKLSAHVRGKPLWEWAACCAEEAGFAHLYLVVGDHTKIRSRRNWHTILNQHAARGMGTSIAAGVAAAAEHRRIVIALADMPMVDPDHLRLLAAGEGTVFTRQTDGSAGCPAAFDRASFGALRTLDGDRGARSLSLLDARIVDPGKDALVTDIDTPSELARYQD